MKLSRIPRILLKAPIYFYRYSFKAFMGWPCRHAPSCSAYGLEAIEKNGAWKGGWLTLSRLIRCRPGGTHGFDPVPDLTKVYHPPWFAWRYGIWCKIPEDN
ncbi:MAG: membrane protein insertion efficiency factor YidD [Methyloligellaceae bacterium]